MNAISPLEDKSNTDKLTIVCAIDFSDASEEAGKVAAALTSKLDGRLVLVHALENCTQEELQSANRPPAAVAAYKALVATAIELEAAGAAAEVKIAAGAVADVICSTAKEMNAALITLGSLRQRGKSWFSDGICETVAERNPTPTLVIRDAEPLLAAFANMQPLKLVFACNPRENFFPGLQIVQVLKRAASCELIAGCVCYSGEEAERLGLSAPAHFNESSPEIEIILERDLRKRLAGESATVRLVPGVGRTDAQLLGLTTHESADLIVCGTHQWIGLDRFAHISVSRGLIRNAETNVLCVPNRSELQRSAPRIQTVLVPSDLSAGGNDAVLHAAALLSSGGTLHLVHVLHPRALPDGSFISTYGTQSRGRTAHAHE